MRNCNPKYGKYTYNYISIMIIITKPHPQDKASIVIYQPGHDNPYGFRTFFDFFDKTPVFWTEVVRGLRAKTRQSEDHSAE